MRTRSTRGAAIAAAVGALLVLAGCVPLPPSSPTVASPQVAVPPTVDEAEAVPPSPTASTPAESQTTDPATDDAAAFVSSPTDEVYGAGDVITVVGNAGTTWEVELVGVLVDASSITSRVAPTGQSYQALEANFTLVAGTTTADVNGSLDFAVIHEGQQYTTSTAVTAVIQSDFWLIDRFSVGDERFGRALVLAPSTSPATQWILISRDTGETWQLEF